jgi:hypothetical protein
VNNADRTATELAAELARHWPQAALEPLPVLLASAQIDPAAATVEQLLAFVSACAAPLEPGDDTSGLRVAVAGARAGESFVMDTPAMFDALNAYRPDQTAVLIQMAAERKLNADNLTPDQVLALVIEEAEWAEEMADNDLLPDDEREAEEGYANGLREVAATFVKGGSAVC